MTGQTTKRMTFGCSLPDGMLMLIDARRGLVPRTRYIEQLLAWSLAWGEGETIYPDSEDRNSTKGANGGEE